MNIITVVPITRLKVPPTLSYFTTREVPIGAIVTIPIRSKSIQATVTETKTAEDIKSEIRNAPYEIRKLGRVQAGAFFSLAFIDSCRLLAEYYTTNMGTVMGAILPETIMENAHRVAPPLPAQSSFLDGAPPVHETYGVQGDESDRMSSWRSLIRQQFAKKKSVVIYAPTIEDVRQIYNSLYKGIEGYIIQLHGSLSKKKILDAWSLIAEKRHPVVVIATPSFSVLPRGDIQNIIIERENARGWIGMKNPYLDYRKVIETIGRREHKTVYLSDTILRVETLHRLEEGEITHGTPFKWRSISTAVDTLVSMKQDPDIKKLLFRILGDDVEELIQKAHEDNTNIFILTLRRGLASITVCNDCETIVSCTKCGTPLVLHIMKQSEKHFFMCHACGERKNAEDTCINCGGHRLSPLGIGTESIRQEIKKNFPSLEIFQIDADTTSTEKRISEVVDRWRNKPGSVLIGTETALHHLAGPVDHIVVASLDSLFTLPDFRIEERLMYTLLQLRAIASRSILIQTRKPEEKIFEYGLKGNLSDFYRAVIADRQKFDYPPFSVLIKITLEGKKDVIAKKMGELQAYLNPHEIDVFPAFTSSDRGTSLIHGLIKIPTKKWPDIELVEKLRQMPPDVFIKINPESLL